MFSFWLLASDLRLAGAMHLPSLHQHRPGVILVAIMDFKVGIISVFVSILDLFKWRNAPVCVWLCFEDYTGFIKMQANKPQIANQTLTVLSFSVILESLILPQSFDWRVFFIVKSRFVWCFEYIRLFDIGAIPITKMSQVHYGCLFICWYLFIIHVNSYD